MSQTIHLTPAEAKCKAALGLVLQLIRDHPSIGWYMGDATESFDLLTEAMGVLIGSSTAAVQDTFRPTSPRNPATPGCLTTYEDIEAPYYLEDDDILEYLASLSVFNREQLLRDIHGRFCPRCAGDNGPASIPCQCNAGITRRFREVQTLP
jgi:hypothetical protein